MRFFDKNAVFEKYFFNETYVRIFYFDWCSKNIYESRKIFVKDMIKFVVRLID